MSLGENIERGRTRAKLSQADLAKKLKVPRSSVNEWESGNHKPRLPKLVELARLFDTTIEELLA